MKKRGVLVIAHGSSKADWIRLVDEAVQAVRLDLPVVTCFLEMVEGRSIPNGIRELESLGVEEIVAVPLFVSSGSTHIEEIAYYLGVTKRPRLEVKEEPLDLRASVRMAPAMDDHPFIADILEERARELSTNPAEEALLLAGHGSDLPGFREPWENGMLSLARQLKERLGFAETFIATLHPDNLRERVEELARRRRVLILPLFLSEGYFTRKVIPSRIEGLDYVYTGKTYLPSPLVSRWIEAVVREELARAEAV